ncbi:MAG: hypothetical protein ABII90_05805 [Bacteroidota bacterium]
MKTLFFYPLLILLAFTGIKQGKTSVSEEIEKANNAGKAVFMVVTDPAVVNTTNALNTAQQAKKLHPKSAVIKMNRSDAVNKELVAKYRLAGAPLPLILVIASNGVVTGGYQVNQATADNLVALIPSPKKAEVLLTLNQRKSAFIVVSKKSMLKKKEVVSKCQLACAEMNNRAKVIEIDLDDTKEKSFLSELKVNQLATQPQTYVINANGQMTGTLSGVVDTKTLIATATKAAGGGCCPKGSKKSCGPTKNK